MASTLQHHQAPQLFGLQTTGSTDATVTSRHPCNACYRHDTMTSDSLSLGGIGLGGRPTRLFADHRIGNGPGIPSGAQKHVIERYQLSEDGTRIVVDFMLEDPEFLATPMTHSRELIFTPQMEVSRFDCDPEAARRFVPK